ncbi:CubicO group peptidase, beta-lactamase class C family [Pedobacter steynii]|uniref:CubicO group peptidase, beta-lactamase class C family n=1 Tax=Pedobacter steynii TaxID=430522 RepID=A0A1H0JMM3_9SPHI|nr:serine hydrolase domain-containing protein [Pedobacter steynii]NQX43105.1 beta-lactamase family protein [Pedobacter steynii]SDO44631.1 CubicO group peptidase, beta-lactamase class C family [Pedobacter steynii]
MKTSFKFFAALLLLSNFSFGQDISKKIDSIIADHHQKNPDVGISVGFIKNNEEHYATYGKLNAENQTVIDKNSLFEIASITKILTANLIAQAVLDHKIKIDDYIDNFLPKAYVLHENLKNKVKISDLASHQSGLPDLDLAKLIALDPQQPMSSVNQETLTAIINNCTELKDYGKYRYSTIGFALLGQIVEEVYGKSYDEIISGKIITPLRMKNTLTKDFNVKNRTTGHSPNGNVQEFMKWNVTAPAGLVKSNAADMVKYLKAVLNKDVAIGKAALITEKIYYKYENRELGLGINIMTDDQKTNYIKSGDTLGQSSMIAYNRAKNWGVIILLDRQNSKLRNSILKGISDAFSK